MGPKGSFQTTLCQLLSYNGVQDSFRRKLFCLKSVGPHTQQFLWRRNLLAYSYLPWLMDGPFLIFPAYVTFSSSCSKKSLSDPSPMALPFCTCMRHHHCLPFLLTSVQPLISDMFHGTYLAGLAAQAAAYMEMSPLALTYHELLEFVLDII